MCPTLIESTGLAFQGLRPGKMPCPLHRDELNLGDIFLGVEFVMRQCQEESTDLHEALTVSGCTEMTKPHRDNGFVGDHSMLFLQVVTAHGICHLLGYRHETEEEWSEVRVPTVAAEAAACMDGRVLTLRLRCGSN